MAVFRIHKNTNYITMGKKHFQEKNMSLKAIGMLSLMLSLPDDWDYSVAGLTAIRSESKNTINSILQELEEFGYLERTQLRNTKGVITGYNYDIYEEPHPKKPRLENPYLENPDMENCTQVINKEVNNKQVNNNKESRTFKKPTLEELEAYKQEKHLNIDPQTFIDYYESNGWKVGRNPMKNWKATANRWSRTEKQESPRPDWIDKEIQKEEPTPEEIQELDELLKDFK